ncbi:hypothetical protein Taro_040609 [Colocasia esculenta]|uniref:Uncharacterized protein n=1 Tax=Colocasia esculenta TaxID=4460 RepID=A0A843WJ76_COLES|nr:hypothetical protein [Colocasia esculenta]
MVVESIAAATSLIGQPPLCQGFCYRDGSSRGWRSDWCRLPAAEFKGRRLVCSSSSRVRPRRSPGRVVLFAVRAQAMEVTKEANWSREGKRAPPNLGYTIGVGLDSSRLWPPSNKADNPALHNPLLRLERMGCGWLGVIFEWEGVIVEDDANLDKQAWLALAQEEGKSPPPAFILRRIEGMKNEQAISEVLCWSRDPSELRRLAARKEEIYQGLQGGFYRLRPGSQEFMSTLANHKIPIAVASTRPRKYLEAAIEAVGVEGSFDAIVTAEDVHRGKPDPEMFVYAAQLLSFIPERCIVFGNSNSTVEAAHDARMKCVAVASKHPVYELSAADLVVRRLDELSVIDLKNLSAIDSPEFGSGEPEVELEEEEDPAPSRPATAVDDLFW